MALLVVVAVGTLGAWTSSGLLKPPVIREVFTRLPCPAHPSSTLEMEGCYEKSIEVADRKIDAQARLIFNLLPSSTARLTFVRGERAWLQYRQASCSAESSRYSGGTLAPVTAAGCQLKRSKAHLRDLTAMRKQLGFH
jgi:uncharacterized protein YecT (DUF1311 family)